MDLLTYALELLADGADSMCELGHPVTTRNAAMDYFISSTLLEGRTRQEQYSEQLVRLAQYFDSITNARGLPDRPRDRASFGSRR